MGILLGILMMVNMVVGVLVLPAVINIIKPKFITGGVKKMEGKGVKLFLELYQIRPGVDKDCRPVFSKIRKEKGEWVRKKHKDY